MAVPTQTSTSEPGPERSSAQAVQHLLRSRGETLGCAESLTGGQLAAALSGEPGASATFVGGVVSYATRIKRELLGVTATRVVSAECARELAGGAARLLGTDWAVATTGVAGPDLQEDQPVGTVFVGVFGPGLLAAEEFALTGDRAAIRARACELALDTLRLQLESAS